MPILCMFYGIIIRMYLVDTHHHQLPHIHAKYAEFEASLHIDTGDVLAGGLPNKQLRLVQTWMQLRRNELRACWELASKAEHPFKIAPL